MACLEQAACAAQVKLCTHSPGSHLVLRGKGHIPAPASRGRLRASSVVLLAEVLLAGAPKVLGTIAASKSLGIAGGLLRSSPRSWKTGRGSHTCSNEGQISTLKEM